MIQPGAPQTLIPNPDDNGSDRFDEIADFVKDKFGNDGFGDCKDDKPHPRPSDAEREHGVSAMIRLVRKYPKQITIIALGPLTNLAMAMRLDPDFKKNVKNIFWTGGSVRGIGNIRPGIEFNSYFNPDAAAICFYTPGPPIVMIPWELGSKACKSKIDWRRNILGKIDSPQIKFLNAIEEKFISTLHDGEWWYSADSKTAAVAINPGIITKADFYNVEVILEGEDTRGMTVVDWKKCCKCRKRNAIIIEDVDKETYKSMLMLYLGVKFPEDDHWDDKDKGKGEDRGKGGEKIKTAPIIQI